MLLRSHSEPFGAASKSKLEIDDADREIFSPTTNPLLVPIVDKSKYTQFEYTEIQCGYNGALYSTCLDKKQKTLIKIE